MLTLLLLYQITVTQAGIVAKSATQTCIITPTSAMCTCTRGDGSAFVCNVWTPMLNIGNDASGYNAYNGNQVIYSLNKRSDGSVWWYAAVRPNATNILTQQGWTKFVVPPVTHPGPVMVGTLVNIGGKSVCLPFGTGFHVVGSQMVSDEVQGNCVLP